MPDMLWWIPACSFWTQHTQHTQSTCHRTHTQSTHQSCTQHPHSTTHTQYTPQSHTPPGEQATLFANRFGNRQERVASAGRRGGGQAGAQQMSRHLENAISKTELKTKTETETKKRYRKPKPCTAIDRTKRLAPAGAAGAVRSAVRCSTRGRRSPELLRVRCNTYARMLWHGLGGTISAFAFDGHSPWAWALALGLGISLGVGLCGPGGLRFWGSAGLPFF